VKKSIRREDPPEETEDFMYLPEQRNDCGWKTRVEQRLQAEAVREAERAARVEAMTEEILANQRAGGYPSNYMRSRCAGREASRNVDEAYSDAARTTGVDRPRSEFAHATSAVPEVLPTPPPSYQGLNLTFPIVPSNRGLAYYVVKKQGVPACVVCSWDRVVLMKGRVLPGGYDSLTGAYHDGHTCRGFVTLEDAFNYLQYHFEMKMVPVVW